MAENQRLPDSPEHVLKTKVHEIKQIHEQNISYLQSCEKSICFVYVALKHIVLPLVHMNGGKGSRLYFALHC